MDIEKEGDKVKKFFLVLSVLFGIGVMVSGALLMHQINVSFRSGAGTTVTRNNSNNNNNNEENGSGYVLRDNATDYQRIIFDELLAAYENYTNVQSDQNKKAYAEAVVKNFIADFYTWSNKEGRNDVGGLQFIAPEIRSEFRSAAIDNFYLYLNQYIEIHGQEALISVSNVIIEAISFDILELPGYESDPFATGYFPYNEEVEDDQIIDVIRVEVSWEYTHSSLIGKEYFQQWATILLVEEEGRLVIRVIEEMNDDLESWYGW